jgi:hypothetical protein
MHLSNRCLTALLVGVTVVGSAIAHATTINFDAVPNNTIITTQYAPLGAVFSSTSGGPRATYIVDVPGEASSLPNFLVGMLDPFQPIIMDFVLPPTGPIGATLISVGDNIVTATAYASDLTTVLDSISVTNPGTGAGAYQSDPITLNGNGVARVVFAISLLRNLNDGFGIDDVTFTTVPEPCGLALLAAGALGFSAIAWRRQRR